MASLLTPVSRARLKAALWRRGLQAAKALATLMIVFAATLAFGAWTAMAQETSPAPDASPGSGPGPDAAPSAAPSRSPASAPASAPTQHTSAAPTRPVAPSPTGSDTASFASSAAPHSPRSTTPQLQAAAPRGPGSTVGGRRSEIDKRAAARKRRARARRTRRARALRHRQHIAARASFDGSVVRDLNRARASTHAADASLGAAAVALLLLGVASAGLLGLVLRVDKVRGWV
jgi:hypothetical protein